MFCVGTVCSEAVFGAGEATGVSGADLYRHHCAACHGLGGHGDGPVAANLSVRVPDLTRIANRHGGTFPEEDVRRIIDGRTIRLAHGTRAMPVWGLLSDGESPGTGKSAKPGAIARLVAYLRSIQTR